MGRFDYLADGGKLPGEAPPVAPPADSETPRRRFDSLLDEPAPSAGAALAVRSHLGGSPEQAAEAARLGRRFQMPAGAVQDYPEPYKVRAALEDARSVLERSPRLSSWIVSQPQRAALVHDEIGALSDMEAAIRTLKALPSAAWAGLGPRAASGMFGVMAAPFEVLGQAQAGVNRAFGADTGGGVAADVGAFFRGIADAQARKAEAVYSPPADAGTIERGIGSGVSSAAMQLLALPFGLAGSAATALGVMGVLTFGQTYTKGRGAGLDPAQATLFGAQDAAAEVITESLPTLNLLKNVAARSGLAKTLVEFLAREIPGELAATTWQSFNEWAHLNPDKPLGEWMAELPPQLAETVVATIVGGGLQVGGLKGVRAIADRASGREELARKAERTAGAVEQFKKLAEAAKLKGRDAETFRDFIAEVAEEDGDAPTEFYVDGGKLAVVLAQSGITREELAAVAPVVASQMDALQAGTDVRVPVSEFAVVDAKVTDQLVDHLRTSPDAITRAEAREVVASAAESAAAEFEATVTSEEAASQFRESIAGLQAQFEAQISASGRRPAVAKAEAALLANLYGAQAVRNGVTPEEFARQYGVRVQGTLTGGARTLAQAPTAEETRAWADGVRAELGLESFDVWHDKSGALRLNLMVVPKDARKRGSGTEAMRRLTQYADQNGLRVTLSPAVKDDAHGTTSRARLVEFYKRFGFVENKGRRKDFAISDGMYRDPAAGSLAQAAFHGTQPFYSALLRGVEGLQIKAAPASGWRDAIRGLVANGKAKADEVEWSGVNEWLALRPGKVSKDDVLGYLRDNGVRVEEVTLGGAGALPKELADYYAAVPRPAPSDAHGWLEEAGKFEREAQRWQRNGDANKARSFFTRAELANEMAERLETDSGKATGATKYSQYTLPGGANYREVLLTLPDASGQRREARNERFNALRDAVRAARPDQPFQNLYGMRDRGLLTADETAELAAIDEDAAKPSAEAFRSPHWDHLNVLAHIRMNDRTDADGKRVLFVEEIQSDWGQAGKKKGFRDPAEESAQADALATRRRGEEELKRLEAVALEAWSTSDPARRGYMPSRAIPQQMSPWLDGANKSALASAMAWAQTPIPTVTSTIPRAPFIDKTDKWLALALKRVVVMAAQDGYDRVAFVTGEQSAERYSLSSQVESIVVVGRTDARTGEKSRSLRIELPDGRSMTLGVNAQGVVDNQNAVGPQDLAGKPLADVIGKEMAERVMNADLGTQRGGVEFKGDGLKVGGEGMRAFYDKIVPAALKDVLKKVSGGPQIAIKIPGMMTGDEYRRVRNNNTELLDEEQRALDFKIQPGFDITPAMREKAGGGLPLFQGGNRAEISLPTSFDTGSAVISLLQGADLSSLIHESGHLFLEILADQAARIQGQIVAGASVSATERGIVDDMNTTLKWFGIADSPEQSALDKWASMTLDEKREFHERFARGFEAYAFEGRAPSLDLQVVFSKFRAWLTQVYRTIAGLNVTLTDDVRAVMDRLLATDQAIAEAEAQRAMGPLFRSAEQAGMTLEQFQAYQALGADATAEASETLDKRSLRDMKWLSRARDKALKARQDEAAEIRRQTRMQVRAEVMAEPVYRAWQFLTASTQTGDEVARQGKQAKPETMLQAIARHGGLDRDAARRDLGVANDDFKRRVSGLKVPFVQSGGMDADSMAERLLEDGFLTPDENGKHSLHEFEDRLAAELRGDYQYAASADFAMLEEPRPEALADAVTHGKLNTTMLREQYGTGEKAIWRRLSSLRMTSETGIDPEIVAETFGFDSGDALVKALAEAPPPHHVIEARTDQRMLEEHGDITSPEALAAAADEAVHNEARARFVAAELAALRKAPGAAKTLRDAAKEYAARIIAGLRVRDLRPSLYSASAARHAKQAEQAIGADKLAEAAMHKRNQLVNLYAARAALDARDDVQKATKYLRKFDKRVESLPLDYQDQIDQLLEAYDFKPISLKEVDRRKALAAWVAEQQEIGAVPDLTPELVANSRRISYKDMTVEELRGLVDAVKQIEHLGRLKNKLLLARRERELDDVAADVSARVAASRPEITRAREGVRPVRLVVEKAAAALRKFSSYVHQMDMAEDGPLFEYLLAPANERSASETLRLMQFARELDDIVKPLRAMPGGLEGKRSRRKVGGESFTRWSRIAIMLNYGNEHGRERLASGDGWGGDQIAAFAMQMSAAELEAVNAIWRLVDSFWPEIAAQARKFGTEVQKVEAVPFAATSADGVRVELSGGYYPLAYDGELDVAPPSQEADASHELVRIAGRLSATTRRGHERRRLEHVDKKIDLSFNVLAKHARQVVHDLTWREWVYDATRLLNHRDVSQAIVQHYGRAVLDSMNDTVRAVAVGDQAANVWDRLLLGLRNNASRAIMGFSATTMLLQPLGLFQSAVRIGGYGPLLHGLGRMGLETTKMNNVARQVAEKSLVMRERLTNANFSREMRDLAATPRGRALSAFDDMMFFGIRKLQLLADLPTWLGQYEKTINEEIAKATAAGKSLDDVAEEVERKAVAQADRVVKESQSSGETIDLAAVQRQWPLFTQFMSFFSASYQFIVERTQATSFKRPASVARWMGDMMALSILPSAGVYILAQAAELIGGDDDDKKRKAWLGAGQEWLSYQLSMIPLARELSGAVKGFEPSGPPPLRVFVEAYRAGVQTRQAIADGDVDEAFVKAWARFLGFAFGLPVVQAIRSWNGWKAWNEESAPATAVLLGPPKKD